jgi:hypothetical protein
MAPQDFEIAQNGLGNGAGGISGGKVISGKNTTSGTLETPQAFLDAVNWPGALYRPVHARPPVSLVAGKTP